MRKIRRLLVVLAVVMMMIPADAAFAAKKTSVIRPGESLQQVRTLAWKATLLRNVRTKYGRFKAGTVVTVVRGGAKCIIRLKGHNYNISRKYLNFAQDLASVVTKGDYTKRIKNTYINSAAHKSKSKYLVWVLRQAVTTPHRSETLPLRARCRTTTGLPTIWRFPGADSTDGRAWGWSPSERIRSHTAASG